MVLADGIALDGAKLAIALDAARSKSGHRRQRASVDNSRRSCRLQCACRRGTAWHSPLGAALEAFSAALRPGKRSPQRTLEFAGRGLSTRIDADPGRAGTIDFCEAKLDTLWPGAIPLAVDAAIKAEPEKLAGSRQARPGHRLSTGNLPPTETTCSGARRRSAARSIVCHRYQGMSRDRHCQSGLKALTFILNGGRSQSGDSRRRRQAAAGGHRVYSGPVASLGTIEPRIDSSALEPELSTRKIERDVENSSAYVARRQAARWNKRLRKSFDQTPPVQRPPLPPSSPKPPSSRESRPAAPG